MTPEQLIAEGRKLERPTIFLRPSGAGPIVAQWYERDEQEIESSGQRRWLTVDARHIPGLSPSVVGYVSVFTDEETCQGGHVEITRFWPKRPCTQLYACPASVLPPVDAVFARGSEAVGKWIQSHGWERTERYNDNFADGWIVDEYERIHTREFPIYV